MRRDCSNVYPPIVRDGNNRIAMNEEASEFHKKIDVTTCNDLQYAAELLGRFFYTMGGPDAVASH